MRAYLLVLVVFALACSEASAVDDGGADLGADLAPAGPLPPVVLETVLAVDPMGVASAVCLPGTRVIGGGCECETDMQSLYRAALSTSRNSYECGCLDGAIVKHGVTATALCVRP